MSGATSLKLAGAVAGLSALAAGPAAHAAEATLVLDHVAARVVVVPEARTNIAAEVRAGKGDLPRPSLQASGTEMRVSGGLPEAVLKSCSRSGRGDSGTIRLHESRSVRVQDLPVVVVRTPMDLRIVADGAVIGEVGPARSMELVQKRCGDWRVGDVSDRFAATLEGRGDLDVGRTGRADLKLEGMGDVRIKSAGAFTASVEGLSKVTLGQVSGPVDVSLEGLGGVRINGGHATTFRASLEGMGSIRFDGVADSADASADGLGGIHIAEVRGPVRKSGSGLARVRVGR
jgi:hypothetical protein